MKLRVPFLVVEVRLHDPAIIEVLHRLRAVQLELLELQQQGEKIMASQAEFEAVLARIDVATTKIAAEIKDLLAKLAAGGLSADEEAALLAKGEAAATRLEGIAADPNNPVPTP